MYAFQFFRQANVLLHLGSVLFFREILGQTVLLVPSIWHLKLDQRRHSARLVHQSRSVNENPGKPKQVFLLSIFLISNCVVKLKTRSSYASFLFDNTLLFSIPSLSSQCAKYICYLIGYIRIGSDPMVLRAVVCDQLINQIGRG